MCGCERHVERDRFAKIKTQFFKVVILFDLLPLSRNQIVARSISFWDQIQDKIFAKKMEAPRLWNKSDFEWLNTKSEKSGSEANWRVKL